VSIEALTEVSLLLLFFKRPGILCGHRGTSEVSNFLEGLEFYMR